MIDVRVKFTDADGTFWSGPIHNPAALASLREAFTERGIPFEEWDDADHAQIADDVFRLSPCCGVFEFGPSGRRPKPFRMYIARLVGPGAVHPEVPRRVCGGFPLLDDLPPGPADDDGSHWRDAARRVAREIAPPSPGNFWQRLLAAIGDWLHGRPRLRVVSPEAHAAGRQS